MLFETWEFCEIVQTVALLHLVYHLFGSKIAWSVINISVLYTIAHWCLPLLKTWFDSALNYLF